MKIEKKTANSAGDLALAYIKYLKAAPALNTRRIFEAWDSVYAQPVFQERHPVHKAQLVGSAKLPSIPDGEH